jgi:ppGpp synthetase/RelA/SpoT-type nucleotidyltranferase
MDSLSKTRLIQVGELGRAKTLLKEATQEAERLETTLKTSNAKELEIAFETLKRKAAELNVKVDDLDNVNSIEELKRRLKDLEINGLEKVDRRIEEMAQTLKGSLGPALS